MAESETDYRNIAFAALVEGGLGVAALAVGYLIGFWPAVGIGWELPPAGLQLRAIGWGLAATLPLLAALYALDQYPLGTLERVRDLAAEAARRIFPQPRWWQLAVISLAAGMGEELLFRGLLQAGLSQLIGGPWGPWIALATAACVFGAFHWLSTTYAVLATLAGLYFGWLLIAAESLWTPIVAHATYDFIALWHLLRSNHRLESAVEE